ncbi:MAG TPA: aldo/keto reductase [Flavobacteriia bacterium]|nr:aldo/keto reductase [Flavobacteriia bacterium]
MAKKELIYGCMGLGGGWNNKPLTSDDFKLAENAIEAALEIGITNFDHADIYTLGKAELVFGQVLKAKPALRDKITLQSKAGICYHKGVMNSSIYDLSKTYLLQQVDNILKRLQTDYLDVFMLHRPDALMNPEEIADAFRALKKAGKVKRFGVSNMSLHQIDFIQKQCDDPLVVNQIELSLGHSLLIDSGILVNRVNTQDFNGIEGLLEYTQSNNITIQAYSPLMGGRFTGNNNLAAKEDKKIIELINQLAEKYNTTASAVLLAWVMKIPGNIQPVIGTTNPQRIAACKDAVTIELSRLDWYNLWITARGEKIP